MSSLATFLKIDGTTGTATCADCRAGGSKMDGNSEKHNQTLDAMYDSQDTEDLSPISVS